MSNRAIWVDKNQKLSLCNIDEIYEPQEGEVLVEVQYSGINPADISHSRFGFNECVSGYDFAGTVVEAGSHRKDQFKPGDHVFGLTAPALNKPQKYGVHQKYHCVRDFVYHLPPTMPMQDAACFMVVTHTAADALFNQLHLPFEPSDNSQTPILIWGASGAVGTAAVQLAKKAGCYPILATASPKNHATLRSLGATHCFDYRDGDAVKKIRSAIQDSTSKPLRHVLDAVVPRSEPSSTSLCEACVDNGQDSFFTSSTPAAQDAKYNWTRTFACRNTAVDFQLPNGVRLVHKPNYEWQANIDKATKWAIDHYGTAYRMPNVVVVKGGDEGMKAMEKVFAGGASMEKFVIEHPI